MHTHRQENTICSSFGPHRTHEMRSIAIVNPVARCVCQSVCLSQVHALQNGWTWTDYRLASFGDFRGLVALCVRLGSPSPLPIRWAPGLQGVRNGVRFFFREAAERSISVLFTKLIPAMCSKMLYWLLLAWLTETRVLYRRFRCSQAVVVKCPKDYC